MQTKTNGQRNAKTTVKVAQRGSRTGTVVITEARSENEKHRRSLLENVERTEKSPEKSPEPVKSPEARLENEKHWPT